MKKVTKIVLTGGPCAGKTSAINLIKKVFSERGYAVLHCAEVPTDLIMSGIAPWTIEDFFDFEDAVLNTQITREMTIEKYSQKLKDVDKVIIICDRGIMDIKAYMNNEEFTKLLEYNNMNENDALTEYDAIFHLVTAACGAKEFYTLENNSARSETIEQAIELDRKTLTAWVGHPHLRIIDNNIDFDAKLNNLITAMSEFLDENSSSEVEKKYLIEKPDLDYILNNFLSKKVEVEHTYCLTGDKSLRAKKRGDGVNFSYYKSSKSFADGLHREKTEVAISEHEYNEILKMDCEKYSLKKERYCFIYNNQNFELDVYPTFNDLAILEIELPSKDDKVDIPECVKVIKDVTDDEEYSSLSIAKKSTLK